ncbi:hypothetical protein SAMN05192588_0690 [Nonlabens sp. Hel1_33_55]|uniref:GIY-YIG nuclease family protein n=1 Tax=Nonlabens sp. Hel1_33_55 TaxID=1336802 RepID=UPI000875B648|nr:GIY-YIG nuclease family protein [Nonlabens sp. Hel1_33_55]SCY00543.1 hypothetical protein SAMN05192588_0690 [Nonlabens sp. Hel1_33_55]
MKKILYLLKFKNNYNNVFKIGITKNLKQRIYCLENATSLRIDYYNSSVITHDETSKINLLEKNLLEITMKWKTKWTPESNFSGMHEVRYIEAFSVVEKFLGDQDKYGIIYKSYSGIDVCGQYFKKGIPKVYFPIDKTIKGISPILKNDINDYCIENNIAYREILNTALYNYAIKIGINRVDDVAIEGYDNFYKI